MLLSIADRFVDADGKNQLAMQIVAKALHGAIGEARGRANDDVDGNVATGRGRGRPYRLTREGVAVPRSG
jgi:hypothetical protein